MLDTARSVAALPVSRHRRKNRQLRSVGASFQPAWGKVEHMPRRQLFQVAATVFFVADGLVDILRGSLARGAFWLAVGAAAAVVTWQRAARRNNEPHRHGLFAGQPGGPPATSNEDRAAQVTYEQKLGARLGVVIGSLAIAYVSGWAAYRTSVWWL